MKKSTLKQISLFPKREGKKMHYGKLTLAVLGLSAVWSFAGIARATNLSPLDLTGYNYDGMADPGQSTPVGNTTGTLDTFSDYFAKGFDPANPSIGLPAGSTFTSAFNNNTTFAIQPYDQNNLLLLGPAGSPAPSPTGTLTLSNPIAVSELAFLLTGFNGYIAGSYALNYAAGPSDSGTFVAPDNFGTGNTAISGFGRYYFFDNIGIQEFPTTPELFELDVTADPTRTLDSITFSNIQFQPTGYNGPPVLGVFGVSASAVPEPTSLAVTGIAAGFGLLLCRSSRHTPRSVKKMAAR
jgi:hypothetical protein